MAGVKLTPSPLTRNCEEMARSLGLLKAPSVVTMKSLSLQNLDFLLQSMPKCITCTPLSGKKKTNYKKTNAEWKFLIQDRLNLNCYWVQLISVFLHSYISV